MDLLLCRVPPERANRLHQAQTTTNGRACDEEVGMKRCFEHRALCVLTACELHFLTGELSTTQERTRISIPRIAAPSSPPQPQLFGMARGSHPPHYSRRISGSQGSNVKVVLHFGIVSERIVVHAEGWVGILDSESAGSSKQGMARGWQLLTSKAVESSRGWAAWT